MHRVYSGSAYDQAYVHFNPFYFLYDYNPLQFTSITTHFGQVAQTSKKNNLFGFMLNDVDSLLKFVVASLEIGVLNVLHGLKKMTRP